MKDMARKRVLFILQSYPSVRSANALCDEKIIQKMIEAQDRYEVFCLVYENYNLSSEETVNHVHIYRFKRGVIWRLLSRARTKPSRLSSVVLRLNRVYLRVKQFIFIAIYPYTEPFLTKIVSNNAVRLHAKYHFDAVISEYHGLDTLHAGGTLKRHDPHIKFLPILWDPFTGKEPAKYLPRGYASWRLEKAEARELSRADKIVVMESSRAYHESHSTGKPYYDRFVYLDIPGIVCPPKAVKASTFIRKGKINIIFAGVLSLPDRDPEPILRVLGKTSLAKDIHMVFFSIGEGLRKLEAVKKDFPGEITISGYVDKEELVATYHGADVLLNLGGPNPTMVPSKVFEYLSYGKPIISGYYIDDEASLKYLERYPLALCVDQRIETEISASLIDKALPLLLGRKIPFDDIVAAYPGNTPGRYLDLIDELLNNKE